MSGRTVLWIAKVRSVPTRSAFSSGPSTASRRPNAALITVSTVSASQMSFSTSEIASRHSACCRRLPTKPGTSFFTCTGVLPASACRVIAKSVTACERPFGPDPPTKGPPEGRVPPMSAERAGAVLKTAHDGGNRDHGRIAGKNRVGPGRTLDVGEQLLLDAKVLAHGFDDEFRPCHGFVEPR